MKLKITKVKDGSFIGSEGDRIEYYWYKAVRKTDDVAIEFGSRNGDMIAGEEYDVNLEKREGSNGKVKYVEVKE